MEEKALKKNNFKLISLIITVVICIIALGLLCYIVYDKVILKEKSSSSKEKQDIVDKASNENNANKRQDVDIIVKEKDDFYKAVISNPQPYCGKNAKSLAYTDADWPDSEKKYTSYVNTWYRSTEFNSYDTLKSYIMNNITEDEAKILNIMEFSDANTYYLEKAGKLYCAELGIGYYGADETTYNVIESNDSKIVATVYDKYADDNYSDNRGTTVEYTMILVKENNLWKIDSYTKLEN